jgi:DNA polymerase delta subunit 1
MFVNREKHKGILPQILKSLLDTRKLAKKAMKNAKNEIEKNTMNGRQLALKVCANSIYGYCGAGRCAVPGKGISSSVTSFGRKMIYESKDFIENNYNGCRVIYGDTDSIMIKFPKGTTVESAISQAKVMEEAINPALFKDPVYLEYEKVFYPYLLMKKKKYVGFKFEYIGDPGKMDIKGLEATRRDNALVVATTMNKVIDMILRERNVEAAINYLKSVLNDIVNETIPIEELVISKALAKFAKGHLRNGKQRTDVYANPQPHASLAKRMEERSPIKISLGDRIQYVVIKGPQSNITDRVEDVRFIKEHHLPIDTTYYIEQQMKKPFIRLFEYVIGLKEARLLFTGAHMRSEKQNKVWSGFVQPSSVSQKRKSAAVIEPTLVLKTHKRKRKQHSIKKFFFS